MSMDSFLDALDAVVDVISELHPALHAVQSLWSICRKVPIYKKQCTSIAERAQAILDAVNKQLSRSPNLDVVARSNVKLLESAFQNILDDMRRFKGWNPMKCLLRLSEIVRVLDASKLKLNDLCNHFAIASLIRVQERQEEAQRQDAKILDLIVGRHAELLQILEIGKRQELEAMYAIQRELAKLSADAPQRKVLTAGFAALQRSVGQQSRLIQSWQILPYDVDIDNDSVLGEGGFATVKKATLFGNTVAVKLFGSGTSKEMFLNEVGIWDRLRHDHVLQMFGACDTSVPIFIVSKYMKNGNVLEYLAVHPDTDRRQIAHEVALGMTYLHAQHIVHGDLKGSNILIDDSGKACIADFGTSTLKQDFFTRTATKITDVIGTWRFMAPEQMEGRLIPASDVYSYALVVYQMFTGDVPFTHVPDAALYHNIVVLKTRLRRPSGDMFLQRGLTTEMWDLVMQCSSPTSSDRPKFAHVAEMSKPQAMKIISYPPSLESSGGDQKNLKTPVEKEDRTVVASRYMQPVGETPADGGMKDVSSVRDRLEKAQRLKNLGDALLRQGHYKGSIQGLMEAKAAFLDIGDRAGEAQCMRILSDVLYAQDDYPGRAAALKEAKEMFEEVSEILEAALCTEMLGDTLIMQHEYPRGTTLLEEAKKLFQEMGDGPGVARCMQSLDDVVRMQGRDSGAILAVEEANKRTLEGIRDLPAGGADQGDQPNQSPPPRRVRSVPEMVSGDITIPEGPDSIAEQNKIPSGRTNRSDQKYTHRARALYAYTASPDDPNEISFAQGEVMDIVLDTDKKWWEARKTDGAAGIVPSNYLELVGTPPFLATPPPGGGSSSMSQLNSSGKIYSHRARALYAYTASPDDPSEISFARGEVLDIVDTDNKWWQARKADGATGIVPSNYLELVGMPEETAARPAWYRLFAGLLPRAAVQVPPASNT